MIVLRQKPLAEILSMLEGHKRVLLVGCNTCAAVSLAGGESEVETLAAALRLAMVRRGGTTEFVTGMLQRQCEPEFIDELGTEDVDAVLSLGCGAGVALLATDTGTSVYPALDTLFIGAATGLSAWQAECSACGSCVMGETGGICPVTRCAKGILNGPCGGVKDGMCELGDRPCAWVQIYERLEDLDRLDEFDDTLEPKDNSVRTKCCELDLSPEGVAE